MIVFIVDKGETMIDVNYYYRYLTLMRARRTRSFINDRGFRHINNRKDKTGVTYAFWYVKEKYYDCQR